MVTVSICMIVKDEEQILERCLASLAGLWEELIIVDTGSSDGTVAIAKKYTSHVYSFSWIDDFSAARNFSISKASQEFIYIADADEVLDEENRQKFLLLKQTLLPEIDVVEMMVTNQLAFNTTYNFDTEYRVKMFRRLHRFRFVDPIHETLHFDAGLYKSDVAVTHLPVDCHGGRDLAAFRRLTNKKIPLSDKLINMYARELFICGGEEDFKLAYDYFFGLLQKQNATERQIRLAECVTARCSRLDHRDMVFFKIVMKSVMNDPCAEICCELGEFYIDRRDYEEALLWFFTAANGAGSELYAPYAGSIPLSGMAKCYAMLGQEQEAAYYRELAKNWQWPEE